MRLLFSFNTKHCCPLFGKISKKVCYFVNEEEPTVLFGVWQETRKLIYSRSHAVSTKRTILSPFAKAYGVLTAYSGMHQFLKAFLRKVQKMIYLGDIKTEKPGMILLDQTRN
ncbi:hypothetical protein F8388_026852 [Cannabis sativa]|uniref:Uncharacterized protein n=1 Tax=Cannabis sativa TaxID=3483 RepID=A0A7J6H1T2_CANSA|nr:hypothetical protein F8388_026852 [Cannabis sativa]